MVEKIEEISELLTNNIPKFLPIPPKGGYSPYSLGNNGCPILIFRKKLSYGIFSIKFISYNPYSINILNPKKNIKIKRKDIQSNTFTKNHPDLNLEIKDIQIYYNGTKCNIGLGNYLHDDSKYCKIAITIILNRLRLTESDLDKLEIEINTKLIELV